MTTITDYIKLEQLKLTLVNKLRTLGLEEEVNCINDDDVNKLITIIWNLGNYLNKLENDKARYEALLNYVTKLLSILIIDYGGDVNKL